MLTEEDLTFVWSETFPNEKGAALAFIIGEDVVYDMPLYNWAADLFFNTTNFVDISDQYPDHEGIALKIFIGNDEIDDLLVSEYFGSILLSNPTIKDLNLYPFGRYVVAPHAKFIDNEFVILNGDVSNLNPFITEEEIQSRLEMYNLQNG